MASKNSKTEPPSRPEIRGYIRDVLAMAPGRRFTEQMILDGVNRLLPEPADSLELLAHMEWNHGKGYIDFQRNHDLDRDEWFLTEAGKAKEATEK